MELEYVKRRYLVFGQHSVPAGRYHSLEEAKRHANTVTYRMYVIDRATGQMVYDSGGESHELD